MPENYLSFEGFLGAFECAPLLHFTSVGITHEGRRFWSKKLARHLGKRGKMVRFFVDPTGPWGDSAVVFAATGEYLANVPEVGRKP